MNNNYFIYNGHAYTTGDSVTCEIHGVEIKDAKLFIGTCINNSCKAHICQNKKQGDECDYKFGYRFSWIFSVNEYGISYNIKNLKPLPVDILKSSIFNIIGKRV